MTEKDKEIMLKLASYKKREVLKDTLSEYKRRGNFERIFPAKHTDVYDKYFFHKNNLNKFIYEFIYKSHEQEEEEKVEVDPFVNMNGFFQDPVHSNKNEHFLDLEAKLRPLKQRPDSAVNRLRYNFLNLNNSNMSTSSTYKHSDSIVKDKDILGKEKEGKFIDYTAQLAKEDTKSFTKQNHDDVTNFTRGTGKAFWKKEKVSFNKILRFLMGLDV